MSLLVEEPIDEDLLTEAQRQLAAPSRNAAINQCLRRVVEIERQKRHDALDELQRMHDEGLFDCGRLDAADE